MPVSYGDLPASQSKPAEASNPGGSGQQQYSDDNPPNFNEDQAGWVRHYYGDEYLEDGKYPRGVLIDHGDQGGERITGYKTTPETHPWLYPGPNDVHTNGRIYPSGGGTYDQSTGKFQQSIKARPEDIRASHDKRNYYKNGGEGVPPEIMRTFVDDRTPGSPYWQRAEANRGKPPDQRPYPSPFEVTGPYGRYVYQHQNWAKNPNPSGPDWRGRPGEGQWSGRYVAKGLSQSRFISNGTTWDPENPLPRGAQPPGGGTGTGGDQSPPPSHREPPADQTPPPPQDTAPPPGQEPPSQTGPVQTQPGPTVSVGGSTTKPATPGSGNVNTDPMAMVQSQGGGLLSQAAPPAQPAPPPQQGALSQAQTQVPPTSGMFGT